MTDDPIYFWVSEDTGWVRVTGDACCLNAPQVRAFGRQVIERGLREVVVDMEECSGVDSTFLGTLSGVALNLNAAGRGPVRLLNIAPAQERAFQSLGLQQLFLFG